MFFQVLAHKCTDVSKFLVVVGNKTGVAGERPMVLDKKNVNKGANYYLYTGAKIPGC